MLGLCRVSCFGAPRKTPSTSTLLSNVNSSTTAWILDVRQVAERAASDALGKGTPRSRTWSRLPCATKNAHEPPNSALKRKHNCALQGAVSVFRCFRVMSLVVAFSSPRYSQDTCALVRNPVVSKTESSKLRTVLSAVAQSCSSVMANSAVA